MCSRLIEHHLVNLGQVLSLLPYLFLRAAMLMMRLYPDERTNESPAESNPVLVSCPR